MGTGADAPVGCATPEQQQNFLQPLQPGPVLQRARLCRNKVRLTILYLLAIQPLCVCVIKDCIGIADSKLSYHLTGLKNADLIDGDQHGNWIIYRLTRRGQKFAYESA